MICYEIRKKIYLSSLVISSFVSCFCVISLFLFSLFFVKFVICNHICSCYLLILFLFFWQFANCNPIFFLFFSWIYFYPCFLLSLFKNSVNTPFWLLRLVLLSIPAKLWYQLLFYTVGQLLTPTIPCILILFILL